MKLKKLLHLLLMLSICYSCKKGAENSASINIDINPVSGKLKSTVKTSDNGRNTNIVTVEYDLLNRVLHYNDWNEDSSYSPVRITSARYISYTYQSTNQFPSKSFITNQNGNIDSSMFYYDTFERLVQEDQYIGTGLYQRVRYEYHNPNLMICRDSGYNSGTYYYKGIDSVFLDNSKSIIAWRDYDQFGLLYISFTTAYDTKSNPFHELNIFKYLHPIGDLDIGYNSPHNFTSFRRTAPGTPDHFETRDYSYSDNAFPVYGSGHEEYNSTLSGNYTIKYIYY